MHLEMANREYAELEIISEIPEKIDVAVGIVDVKSYFIEPVDLLNQKSMSALIMLMQRDYSNSLTVGLVRRLGGQQKETDQYV